jgi:cystathionine beta-lyase
MKYNFDEVINRRGTNSYKWDNTKEEGVIPMWVADMDFQVAPCITNAIKKRVEHGIFGYTTIPESYYTAITDWYADKHQWKIEKDWIIYTSGVVPAISCCIKALTLPGEKVLIQTPVYNCFFSCIKNQGCEVVENELERVGDTYQINFEDFEKKCADEKTTVFLLCNPHNPTGRVWTKEELTQIHEICKRNHVIIISDEIHCGLIMPGYHFTSFGAINEQCQEDSIILSSPSKSFNTAGLQIANIICSNSSWRRRINRVINIYELCDVNIMGPIALEAAYSQEGAEWLNELNAYIWDNYLYLKEFFLTELPQVEIIKLEGTYLAWIDIMCYELSSDEAFELLMQNKVFVNSGTLYGKKSGEGYLRINLACPRETLKQGLIRIAQILSQYGEDSEETGCPM